MSANSRLTLAVHTLTWMAHYREQYEFATSERMARSVHANPVVLRGLLGMMEKHHLVRVQRGSNAGWQLACEPQEITLRDIYNAVEQPELFALHHTPPNPRCTIGYGIGPTLEDVYARAQNALEDELARTTIADILRTTLAHSCAAQRELRTLEESPQT